MEIIIGIILALLTLAYVVYPFFRPEQVRILTNTNKINLRPKNESEDDFETQIMKLRQKRGNVCPTCGTINQLDARYCRQCAVSLGKGKKVG